MITVLGLGFVGLTTALGFSEKGFKVYGHDIDKDKLNSIKNKKIPFFEEGLQSVLNMNLGKTLILVNEVKDAIKNSIVIFLCVGTPSDDTGGASLDYIKSAIDSILKEVSPSDKKIIVIKSTVPPSATKKDIIKYIETKGFIVGKDIYIANNPEFLREGYAWSDFIEPDRVVIGTEDKYVKETLHNIYSKFNVPIHYVTLNTGEFIKYLSNTFLATLISYSNEMSIIADSIGGIDIKTAFKIFHEDKRWFGVPANMQTYAYPGCGFGGYCLPKDTQALVQKASECGHDAKILKNVLSVNNEIKLHWIEKVINTVQKDETISIFGLSFKPNSDDVRQTPASVIIKLLLDNGYKKIVAYDPMANNLFDKMYKFPIKYAENIKDALNKSSAAVVITACNEFRQNKDMLFKDKLVFDLRYAL
jgi:UDPglucose 6-dehydrogenase